MSWGIRIRLFRRRSRG